MIAGIPDTSHARQTRDTRPSTKDVTRDASSECKLICNRPLETCGNFLALLGRNNVSGDVNQVLCAQASTQPAKPQGWGDPED